MRTSVVIPARDSAEYVGELLSALLGQTKPPCEIVVVDAGSVDDTAEIISRFSGAGGIIKLKTIGSAYPGKARNVGAAAAAGDVILMTDSDTLPDKRWIELLTGPFEGAEPPDVVFGAYTLEPENLAQRCMSFSVLARGVAVEERKVCTDSFVSAAFRREAWARTGGFPEGIRAGEDLMLMRRVRSLPLKVAYALGAEVRWRLPKSLGAILRRTLVYVRERTFGGYSSVYDLKLAAFYPALVALFFFSAPAAASVLALVMLFRVPRTVLAAGPAHKSFLFSPLNWGALAGFYLLTDLAHAAGWVSGSLKKLLAWGKDAG